MIRQGVSDALLSVASLLGYLVLISLQYSLMLVLAVRTAAHKWKHKLSFVPLNSATGHSALVALKECTSHLNGLPKDVGLAVLEDDVNLAAVSKLILWCMAVGIKTLSVYDINGTMLEKLEEFKTSMQSALLDARCNKTAVKFVDAQNAAEPNPGDVEIEVYVVTPKNGRAGLASALRTLCEDYKRNLIKDEDITQEKISEYIRVQENNMPEPELVLRFGNSDAILGYLPWHINHSEILDLGRHATVLPSEFVEVLERYTKIEKRYGK